MKTRLSVASLRKSLPSSWKTPSMISMPRSSALDRWTPQPSIPPQWNLSSFLPRKGSSQKFSRFADRGLNLSNTMPIITMPKLSDTMVEGTIARWKKKQGDTVETGDILAEVETDKATMEMEAFDDGVLKEIYVPDGGVAKVGEKIALVLAEGESPDGADAAPAAKTEEAPAAQSAQSKAAPPPAAPAPAAPSGARVKASPLAKKIAAERGVGLDNIQGSGPGGRIVAKDIPEKGAAPSAAPPPAAAPAPAPKIQATAGEGDKRVPLTGMRRVIAERLLASKTQLPHFYLTIEVDASSLMRLRKELNGANEAAGLPKLTINDFILLAVARAASSHPYINA